MFGDWRDSRFNSMNRVSLRFVKRVHLLTHTRLLLCALCTHYISVMQFLRIPETFWTKNEKLEMARKLRCSIPSKQNTVESHLKTNICVFNTIKALGDQIVLSNTLMHIKDEFPWYTRLYVHIQYECAIESLTVFCNKWRGISKPTPKLALMTHSLVRILALPTLHGRVRRARRHLTNALMTCTWRAQRARRA